MRRKAARPTDRGARAALALTGPETATGTAGSATPSVSPSAGNAAGSGTAGSAVDSIATAAGNAAGTGTLVGRVTIAAQKVFELQYYAAAAGSLGGARNVASETEVYAQVEIIDLTAAVGTA